MLKPFRKTERMRQLNKKWSTQEVTSAKKVSETCETSYRCKKKSGTIADVKDKTPHQRSNT